MFSLPRHSPHQGLPARLVVPLVLGAWSLWPAATAEANSYAMKSSQFLDRPLLQSTIQSYASRNTDIDEMASTPSGDWVVVAGSQVVHSAGFPAAALAKIDEYIGLGLEIDVVAFAPNGGWMVIAEHLAWHSAGLSYVATLEQKILSRINAGKRITELAFDSDGSGWTLISGGWAHTVSMPSDLYAAILERHQSDRTIRQIEMSTDGRWALLADDWFASSGLSASATSWLESFQRSERSLDRLMLGLSGNYVLFSNGSYQPDLSDPIQAIEYGMSDNIWQRMEDLKVAGVSLALIEGGQLKHVRGYGVLEAGTQRFVRSDSPFDTASVSKFVAGLGMMTMVDDGVLGLDSNAIQVAVEAYTKFGVPYWSSLLIWMWYGPLFADGIELPASGITLRRVLSHSASLKPHSSTSYLPGDKLPTQTWQMLFGHNSDGNAESYGGGNLVWHGPDNGPPGTQYDYSGGGFLVAESMAEALVLQPFELQMKDRVLDPLGMEDSTYVQPLAPSFAARAAVGHAADGSALPPGSRRIYPWAAAGGLYASSKDLARAVLTVMDEGQAPNGVQLLQPGTVQTMLTQQAPNARYGIGMSLSASAVTPVNGEWFAHTGSHGAAKARIAGNPALGSGIVILINKGGDDGATLREEIYSTFKGVYGW